MPLQPCRSDFTNFSLGLGRVLVSDDVGFGLVILGFRV